MRKEKMVGNGFCG